MATLSRRLRADAIRFLAMDAVQQAKSGHPGMPMGMADVAEVLWHDFLAFNPRNPSWLNRDRFILSNGHGCMLQYALLHLSGYDLTIDDLKQFRQLHSKTPGHPELSITPGVETTTGPLGQGLANAVGMALAQKHLAATFNRPGFPILDHYTYCFVGDGCLMEGISHEVCSLAGTLGLDKLIVFYDDNGISIDGNVSAWFGDHTPQRFAAYNWHVIENVDGHDGDAIYAAILAAKAEVNRPTLICCKTTIGFGSPKLAGTAATHGAPLGDVEIAAIRAHLSWVHEAFHIDDAMYQAWDTKEAGSAREREWQQLFNAYQSAHPDLAQEFLRRMQGELPAAFQASAQTFLQTINSEAQTIATRKASQRALNFFANYLPEIMGGSADLTESNCTNWQGMIGFTAQKPEGRYVYYGVREFGMSAMMNGMALYKGVIPFGGTFLTFSDYARNAVRLAALMQQRVIFVYTHDSIGLGEDGPTHQPIEHIPSLRLIPNLVTWRPCDTVETAVAWQCALQYAGPSCLMLSRQNLPFQVRTDAQLQAVQRGGYILSDDDNAEPHVILIATGSEVALAMQAASELRAMQQLHVRVVSMPSPDVFLQQEQSYQEAVLPTAVTCRVAIEAASPDYWYRFVGLQGVIIGIDTFGASAPADVLFEAYGFSVQNIVDQVTKLLNTNRCETRAAS